MIIPVRCFTCGKVISSKWNDYKMLEKQTGDSGRALDKIQIRRMCCRRMFLTHVDIIDKIIKYENLQDLDIKY